jgi:hypothetical protein
VAFITSSCIASHRIASPRSSGWRRVSVDTKCVCKTRFAFFFLGEQRVLGVDLVSHPGAKRVIILLLRTSCYTRYIAWSDAQTLRGRRGYMDGRYLVAVYATNVTDDQMDQTVRCIPTTWCSFDSVYSYSSRQSRDRPSLLV